MWRPKSKRKKKQVGGNAMGDCSPGAEWVFSNGFVAVTFFCGVTGNREKHNGVKLNGENQKNQVILVKSKNKKKTEVNGPCNTYENAWPSQFEGPGAAKLKKGRTVGG